MGSELEQSLLSPSSSSMATPRILDRDGTFSQSRGRWSVSNTVSRSQQQQQAFGSARQRRSTPVAPASNAHVTSPAGVPYGVAPSMVRSPASPPPSFWDRMCCCCKAENYAGLTPRRCWDDWFHTLSYTPTCILMLGVFTAYFITIVVFAGLYLTVNKVGEHYGDNTNGGEGKDDMALYYGDSANGGEDVDLSLGSGANDVEVSSFCGMDINNHMEALYFSLSTMATIGYGTSDYYFGECWTPFILVLLQVFSAIVFSSLAIGLLFQRMSRGQKRGRTIVFSDVAVIRKVRGRLYWMFRVAELRKRHIIGAKVRVFCVRHERCPVTMAGEEGGVQRGGNNIVELETAHYVSHPLPLLNGSQSNAHSSNALPTSADTNEEEPNSESSFEQSILMGLPHVVVHRMDSFSPMVPPRPVWYDEGGIPHGPTVVPLATLSEAPTESTIGESATEEDTAPSSLLMEEAHPVPSPSTFLRPLSSRINTDQPTQEEVTHFLQDRQAEIIVFVEGTCEVTGMALQARHSYRMEDIAFNQTFAPCVFPVVTNASTGTKRKVWNPFSKNKAKVDVDTKVHGNSSEEVYTFQGNAALEIDFSQFHDLLPTVYDAMSCPYIPSSSTRKR